jgi:C4-dicarboxylate-binding protein DctP
VTNIVGASLYQYQKYATLDGHVWSVHAYMINDRFLRRLSSAHRAAILEGTRRARDVHRQMTSAQDLAAREILEKHGMQVTVLSPGEIDVFRRVAQPPVRRHVEQTVGKAWVDKLFAAIAEQRR